MTIKLDNYARKVGERSGRQRYRWRVFVAEPEEVLRTIRSVTYRLHPTFPNPVRLSVDRQSKFAIESVGWGEFEIAAAVEFNDGADEETRYQLRLNTTWPETPASSVELTPAVQGIPAPEEGELVTSAHVALTASCWRAQRYDEAFDQHSYRFDVILVGAPSVLDSVEYVEYFLPPAWPPESSPRKVYDRLSAFKLKDITWADLFVRAEVHFTTQPEVVQLGCFVGLSEAGRKI
jgi:YEATS family